MPFSCINDSTLRKNQLKLLVSFKDYLVIWKYKTNIDTILSKLIPAIKFQASKCVMHPLLGDVTCHVLIFQKVILVKTSNNKASRFLAMERMDLYKNV